MPNRKKLIEAVKSLFIVLLLISALILGNKTDLFSHFLSSSAVIAGVADFAKLIGGGQPAPGDAALGGDYSPAAMPRFIMMNSQNGLSYCIKYNRELLADTYRQFSVELGEALGSSGEPVMVPMREWEAALVGPGVFFDFLYEQPLDVLSGWLGMYIDSAAKDHTARYICLARDGDNLDLYYIREKDHAAYKCDTALSYGSISSKLESYSLDNSSFAFEFSEDYDLLDPYFIILNQLPEVYELTAGNPLYAGIDEEGLLGLLNINSIVAIPYTEPDGTKVYVDGDVTLRVYPSGIAVFRQSGEEGLKIGTSNSASSSEVVEKAYSIAAESIGKYCGAAEPCFTGITYNAETEIFTITFDYSLNGLPIKRTDGLHALEMQVKNGIVTNLSLNYREYGFTGSILSPSPLPEKQAAVLVQAKGGGEPLLVYEDSGSSVSVSWLIN